MRRNLFACLVLLAGVLSACGTNPPAAQPDLTPARPAAAATPSPGETPTAQASQTAEPTPRPTQTRWPTATPTRPTATRAATREVTWLLDWADEFDVDGPPNPQHWGYESGFIRNNETQYYTVDRRENARVEGGYLIIEARGEEYEGARVTSASLNTWKKHDILYGRIEVRAKVPAGTGTWPAIWLLGTNIEEVGWPDCGEVDIMEYVGFTPGQFHCGVHMGAYNSSKGNGKSRVSEWANAESEFHVFVLNWFPDRMDFMVDDTLTFTYWNEGLGEYSWPFDQPQYLLLNLAIGGAWGGQMGVDESIFPAQYLIDYVRVYKAAD